MNKFKISIIKYFIIIITLLSIYNYYLINNNNFKKQENKSYISYFQKNIYLNKKNEKNFLFEKKKYHEGDTIFVIIKEKILINSENSKKKIFYKKKNDNILKIIPKYFNLHINNKLNFINENNLEKNFLIKKKKYIEKKNFLSLITVTIEKILPNGYLNIVGNKILQINEKKTNIYISGIINPDFINTKNYILSNKISNLNIQYNTIYKYDILYKIYWLVNIFKNIFNI